MKHKIKIGVDCLSKLETCHQFRALMVKWAAFTLETFTQVMRHINSEQGFSFCSEFNLIF